MFCIECGAKNKNVAKFCYMCGTKLSIHESTKKKPITENDSIRENPSAWFKICSPFEGKVITSLEYYKIRDKFFVSIGEMTQDEADLNKIEYEREYENKNGYMKDIFVVMPTVGIAKAPFDCTVGEDSALNNYYLCADNGVAVKIGFMYEDEVDDDKNFYDSINTNIKLRDRVKKGDVLFRFDVSKLPKYVYATVEIDDFCFNGLPFTTEFKPIENLSSVSFGDTIFDVDGDQAPFEIIEANIAGHRAIMELLNSNMEKYNQTLSDTIETMQDLKEQWEEQDIEIDNQNMVIGKIKKFWDMKESLSEYDDLNDEMFSSLKSLKFGISTKSYKTAIEVINEILYNVKKQMEILADYENTNINDGFEIERERIKNDLRKKNKIYIDSKKSFQKYL